MKYLFLNTVCNGSTGRIIEGIGKSLTEQGNKCVLVYGRGKPFSSFFCKKIGNVFSIMFHAALSRFFDKQGHGSFFATKKLVRFIKEYDPDVIWLHNIHGYYVNIRVLFGFLKNSKFLIKWTLHDCWPITGHCCYFSEVGCEKWKTQCCSCPQKSAYPSAFLSRAYKNFIEKKKLFTNIAIDELIVPSNWMKNNVQNSFLKNKTIRVLNNDLDHNLFFKKEKEHLFTSFKKDKKVILGVANVWEKRKGLSRFVDLSKTIDNKKYCLVLIGLSKKQIKKLPPSIYGFERVNIQTLIKAYLSSDIYINLSTEETFGMTTLEALSCGIPAIVLKNTACEEVALRFENGYVVENNPMIIYKKIEEILNGK